MKLGDILHLTKAITTKSDGIICQYKLVKDAVIPVLVLPTGITAEQLAAIRAVFTPQAP